MRSNLIFSFFLITCISCGQSNDCKTIGDKQNGLYVEYYPDCRKKLECYFDGGRYDSTYTEWEPDGKLKIKGSYKNGTKDGVWHYQGILLDGTMAKNYIYSEYKYDRGVIKSAYEYIGYSSDSLPKNSETFVMYEKDTISRTQVFDENGKLNNERYDINGMQDSVARAWDRNGRLFIEGYYKKSHLLKEIRYYFDYKSIEFCDEEGIIQSLKQYDNSGKLIYEEYYDTSGEEIKVVKAKGVKRGENGK